MASDVRVAVVGGGIIGCAIAFELSRRGADVTVYDAGTIGGGATQASAGILAPFTEAHDGGALFDLTVRGLAAYDPFVADVRAVSVLDFEYRRAGTIEIAQDPVRAASLQSRASAPDLVWFDAATLRRRVPDVTTRAVGGLWCPLHAHVQVRAFAAAIVDAATRRGARFVEHAAVERIDMDADGVTLRIRDADHRFDRVILCAGAWSPSLDPHGVLAERIAPVRGQLVKIGTSGREVPHVLWSESCYLVPWMDGTVLVGATSEEAGFEVRATVEGVRGLLAAAADLVPSLASATFQDVLVGLRPGTKNGIPILGPGPDPRLIYAAGHYRNGVLLAPLTARLIGDYVFTNAVDPSFERT